MFSQQYEKDLAAWKKTRPQYRTLLDAIKGNEPADTLAEMGDDAGVYLNEISELTQLRNRATLVNTRQRAAKFDKVRKDLDVLTSQIAEVEKIRQTAKTLFEQDEAASKVYDMVETRQRLQMAMADATVAHGTVEAAKTAGVL